MGIIDSLKQHVHRVTGEAEQDLGRLDRALQYQVRLWRFCAWRLKETNAMAMSAALSFRTIFALVPILVLVFLLLKSVGVVENSRKMLHEFLDQSGLTTIEYTRPEDRPPPEGAAPDASAPHPHRALTVAGQIERIVGNVEDQLTIGRLGPIGAVLLVWTALTLLMTMERSLNRIFEAPRHRPLARRIILYWSVVTLGPLVLLAAGYASGKAFDAISDMPYLSYVIWLISWLSSAVVGIFFLALVYTLMPNTSVPFRKAAMGAAVAFPAWLAARWAFGLYIEYVGIRSLYGALALLPLFLLWLNLSWTIFLLGAQLVFGLSNRSRVLAGGRSLRQVMSHWDLLAALVSVARANRETGRPVPSHRVAGDLALAEDQADHLLAMLAQGGLVAAVADGGRRRFVLARPADTIAVASVMDLGGGGGDNGRAAAATWSRPIGDAIADVRRRAGSGLQDLTLAALAG